MAQDAWGKREQGTEERMRRLSTPMKDLTTSDGTEIWIGTYTIQVINIILHLSDPIYEHDLRAAPTRRNANGNARSESPACASPWARGVSFHGGQGRERGCVTILP